MVVNLTEAQKKYLAAMAGVYRGLSAQQIAYFAGCRPSRKYALAVSRSLSRLLREDEESALVYRSPPRDQWDHASWGLTDAGRQLISETQQENGAGK